MLLGCICGALDYRERYYLLIVALVVGLVACRILAVESQDDARHGSVAFALIAFGVALSTVRDRVVVGDVRSTDIIVIEGACLGVVVCVYVSIARTIVEWYRRDRLPRALARFVS